jgi:hypothetical protein
VGKRQKRVSEEESDKGEIKDWRNAYKTRK